jgi:hypothetical protein
MPCKNSIGNLEPLYRILQDPKVVKVGMLRTNAQIVPFPHLGYLVGSPALPSNSPLPPPASVPRS